MSHQNHGIVTNEVCGRLLHHRDAVSGHTEHLSVRVNRMPTPSPMSWQPLGTLHLTFKTTDEE